MNEIKQAFDSIHASEELCESTLQFLQQQQAKTTMHTRRWIPILATACCLFFFVIGGIWYNSPTSYLSLDVNPSIELGLNPLNLVVQVTSFNPEAAAITEQLPLKHRTYTEAVELLLSEQALGAYTKKAKESFGKLTITVVSERAEELTKGIEACRGFQESKASCQNADSELHHQARNHDLSTGKYQAFLLLSEYEPNLTPEDCADWPMSKFRQRIASHTQTGETERSPTLENGNGHKNEENKGGHNSGNGNGNGNGSGKGTGNGNGNGGGGKHHGGQKGT